MATTTLSNEEILEAIGNKSVLELADLIDAFKTKFNVTVAAAPVGGGGAAARRRPRPRRRRSSPSSSRRVARRRSRSSRWSARSPAWA
jgi:ribosomal protein L7/L12